MREWGRHFFNKSSSGFFPVLKALSPLLLAFLFSGCLVSESQYDLLKESKQGLEEEFTALRAKAQADAKQVKLLTKELEAKDKLLTDREANQARVDHQLKEQQRLKAEFEAYRAKYPLSSTPAGTGPKAEGT